MPKDLDQLNNLRVIFTVCCIPFFYHCASALFYRRLCPADIRVISRMCSTISTTESSVQWDHESGTVCQHTSDSWTYRTALLDSFWRCLFRQWDQSSTFSFLLSCLLTYRADRGWTGKS